MTNKYKDAGVDIIRSNLLINRIKRLAKSSFRKEVLSDIGGFNSLFEIPINKYKHPVLVASNDGVGTKVKLAYSLNINKYIGIDLVAMCVNDLIVNGAEPLFFLDYYATGKLDSMQSAIIIEGIVNGCKQSGCSLIGGETAEMPGTYHSKEYDLAGFCVGIIEKSKIITKHLIKHKDIIIALSSSGLHSNGFSLVRKIIKDNNINIKNDQTLGKTLLKPTKIYVKTILSLLQKFNIHGISHITGGGLTDNIPRILPEYTYAKINLNNLILPEIFQWLKKVGNISEKEMLQTFNCGVGMILVISPNDKELILDHLRKMNECAWEIGFIENNINKKESYVDYYIK